MSTRTLGVRLVADPSGLRTGLRQGADEVRNFGRTVDTEMASVERLSLGRLGSIVGIAGTLGTVLHKGWERFTTIEDAAAALNVTLGDTEQVSSLLASTLNVVSGTPFNLDQFIDAGKRLIAVGEDADRVPTILRAIGEAAAASGNGAQGVDVIVDALQRMLALGRVTNEELNSLSYQGVPALQILANTAGVSTEEMRKMVSDGAVPARAAIDALVKGITEGTEGAAGSTRALAGSMENLRDTTTGALGGLGAAAGRLGAGVLGLFGGGDPGEVNQLAAGLQGVSSGLDKLTGGLEKIEPATQWLIEHREIVLALAAIYGVSLVPTVYRFVASLAASTAGLVANTLGVRAGSTAYVGLGTSIATAAVHLGALGAIAAGGFVAAQLRQASQEGEAFAESLKEGLDLATDEGWAQYNARLREHLELQLKLDEAAGGEDSGFMTFMRTIFDADFRKIRGEIEATGGAMEDNSVSALNNAKNIDAVAQAIGVRGSGWGTSERLRELAKAAGVDFSGALAASGPERDKFIQYLQTVGEETGWTTDQVVEFGVAGRKSLEELTDAAEKATEKLTERFGLFGGGFELPEPDEAARRATEAAQAVADAEAKVAEARANLEGKTKFNLRTPSRDRETARARRDLVDAERELADARRESREAAELARDPEAAIRREYEEQVDAFKGFLEDYNAAAQTGLSPQFLARAMQDPEQYAGILNAIAEGGDKSLVKLINESEAEIDELGSRAEKMLGLTMIGVEEGMAALNESIVAGLDEALNGTMAKAETVVARIYAMIHGAQEGVDDADPKKKRNRKRSDEPFIGSAVTVGIGMQEGGVLGAHIATSPTVLYGERGTGGEAYIPLGPAHRGRSMLLLADVASRFGYGVVPMQRGGILGGAGTVNNYGPQTHSRGGDTWFPNANILASTVEDAAAYAESQQRLARLRGD